MRIKKSLRKMIAAAFAVGSFAVMPLVSAEVKEYEGFGEYVMSDFETPDVAKQRPKARADMIITCHTIGTVKEKTTGVDANA